MSESSILFAILLIIAKISFLCLFIAHKKKFKIANVFFYVTCKRTTKQKKPIFRHKYIQKQTKTCALSMREEKFITMISLNVEPKKNYKNVNTNKWQKKKI